jgi:predicted site-specific integrase-resolvase
MTDPLLTTDDVMTRLRVSRRTVERYRRSIDGQPPRLPTYRTPGGEPRFRAEDVEALITPDAPHH